jgi:hypothetical protein
MKAGFRAANFAVAHAIDVAALTICRLRFESADRASICFGGAAIQHRASPT